MDSEVLSIPHVWSQLIGVSVEGSKWTPRLTIGIARMHNKPPMASRQAATIEMNGNSKPIYWTNAIVLAITVMISVYTSLI